jgi:hypothetical protein
MTLERAPQGPTPEIPPLAIGGDPTRIGLQLQVLATEHWSLLATRSMTWNETFTRASMFLSALSAAIVALALMAQATAFGESFTTFALVILPVVFFLGLATFIRLMDAFSEDGLWVQGMNRIRAGYLEIVPEVAPYLITSPHDDFAGLMITMGVAPTTTARRILSGFVTTPAVVWVVDCVVAGAIVAIAAGPLGAPTPLAVGVGAAGALVTLAAGVVYAQRIVGTSIGAIRPLNPTPTSTSTGDGRRRSG